MSSETTDCNSSLSKWAIISNNENAHCFQKYMETSVLIYILVEANSVKHFGCKLNVYLVHICKLSNPEKFQVYRL